MGIDITALSRTSKVTNTAEKIMAATWMLSRIRFSFPLTLPKILTFLLFTFILPF